MGFFSGLGSIGAGIGGLFGGHKEDPSKKANEYISKIPGQTAPYYQPYINAGKDMLPQLQSQYFGLMNDPGGMLNKMGASYQQSPGFKFALDQALGAAGRGAAAGGMAGSPMHEQENMGVATGLANQDYYNWLGNVTGLFGQGLQGGQNIANMGQQASGSMADMIAQSLAQQAAYKYQGQAAKNASNPWGNIFGGAGEALDSANSFGNTSNAWKNPGSLPGWR